MPITIIIALSITVTVSIGGCASSETRDENPLFAWIDRSHPVILEPDSDSPEGNPQKTTNSVADQLSTRPVKVTDAASDLWERIRSGFTFRIPDQLRIKQEIAWFQSKPDYLGRVFDRARPYLHYIVEQVEARGIPMEIALLPVVESAFQPFAYSPGRAAGIWQFIPGTGRRFGLKQNWWYDGRRDITDSTRAALEYLHALNQQFNGDWLLALAAYNCGEGNVQKAIRLNQKHGKPTDFWHLKLPRETRGYVPRLLAVVSIINQPQRYGLQIKTISNEPYLEQVETGGQIDLTIAAKLTGISIDKLYRLNPGYNRWATDPKGPHRLMVPVKQAQTLRQNLAGLPGAQRIKWIRYRIRNGETLSHIAKRYHTDVAMLKQSNRLRTSRIRAGRHLLIPVATQSSNHYALSVASRLKKLQAYRRTGSKHRYTVQPGDTLWGISRRYRVSVNKLAKWNGVAARDILRPGQRLTLWTRDRNFIAVPTSIAVAGHQGQHIRMIHYTVRRGDSLSRISQKFNVTVANLRRWNRLPRNTYLQPGQRLKVFIDITNQAKSS